MRSSGINGGWVESCPVRDGQRRRGRDIVGPADRLLLLGECKKMLDASGLCGCKGKPPLRSPLGFNC